MAVNVKNEIAKTCQAILSFVTTNTEWKRAEWVVQPEKSGMLALIAASRWNTNHFQLWMLYDDFELSGATLSQGDFESEDEAIKAWQIKPAAGGATIVRDKTLAQRRRSLLESRIIRARFAKHHGHSRAGVETHVLVSRRAMTHAIF